MTAAWTPLDGEINSGVASATWGSFEVEVFAIQRDGQLWNRYWDGESWHPWEPMGGEFEGTPAAAARDADRIDVFAVSKQGDVHHRLWDGTEWIAWHQVQGAPSPAKGISCSWGADGLHLSVVARDGALWHSVVG